MVDTAWRLAGALLIEACRLGQAEAVEADLARLQTLVTADADIRRFINHPLIPLIDKQKVLCPVSKNELVKGVFCELLARRDTGLIPAICSSYTLALRRRTGRIDAVVQSAGPLTPEEQRRVHDAICKRTGCAASLRVVVDPELIGGLRVQLDGQVIDNSLRARLETMKERLLAS